MAARAFLLCMWRCRLAAIVAVLLAFTAVAAPYAHAQVTWTGSNGLWSAPNAWSTPLATGTFSSGLVFAGNTLTSSTNDYTTGTATSITFNSTAGAFTISGSAFSLAGNVANSNANTQTIQNNIFLAGNSTFTGTAVTLTGTLTISGGNRSLTNNLQSGQLLTLGSINLSESNTGRTFTVGGSGSTAITGSIGNGGTAAGNLTKNGTGTLTIAANNGYGGTTTVSAGVLRVAGSGTAFGSGTVSLTNVASVILDLNGFSQSIAALTGGGVTGGNVIIGGGTLDVGSANTTTTFGGAFTGTPGTLVKQGLGGLTLNGTTSSFSGVTLQAGQLTVSPNTTHAFALGTLSRSAGSGLVLQRGSGTITVDPATPGSGSIIGPWAVMGATTSLTYATHSSGTIVGYTASGTAATASGLTGFSSSENVLLQANSGAMPSSLTVNTIRFAAGNTMTIGSNTLTVNGLMNAGGSGLVLSGGTVAIGSANELVLVTNDKGIEIRSVLRETAPGQRLTLLSQGGGALTLNATGGSNQITGAINAMGGNLSLNASGTYGAVCLEASRTLTANFSGVQQIGAIAGVGSTFTKQGTGTTNLTGNNSYTGATTVSGGQLHVSAGSINSSSGITVNGSGAELKYNSATPLTAPLTFTQGTISGTGTIGTAVTVGSNGIISPGNSPGVQAYTSGLTWATGGSYLWEINDWTGGAGTAYDQIAVSGSPLDITATSGSTFSILITSLTGANASGNVPNFDGNVSKTFMIATSSAGISGFDASKFTLNTTSFTNTYSGSWSLSATGSTVLLNYNAAVTTTTGSYSLSASAGAATIIVGGSSTITATITNTGAGTADAINYNSLAVGNGVTISPSSGSNLAQAASGTGTGVFTTAAPAVYSLAPTASVTNATLGGAAVLSGSTAMSVTVLDHATSSLSGLSVLTSSTISLGTWDYQSQSWTSGAGTSSFSIFNLNPNELDPSLVALLNLTGTSAGGDSGFTLGSGLTPGSFTMIAGGTWANYSVSFDPTGLNAQGNYNRTFTFQMADQSLPGGTATNTLSVTAAVIVVPEPGAISLAGIGIAAAAYAYRRRRLGARIGN
jgi:fibronectin-binding autotransporter adhesin